MTPTCSTSGEEQKCVQVFSIEIDCVEDLGVDGMDPLELGFYRSGWGHFVKLVVK
jgi:hypothetical protein